MDVSGGRPAWWQVDLEQPTEVSRVVVVGYFGDQRHYGFTVEISPDGKQIAVTGGLPAQETEGEAPILRVLASTPEQGKG